MEFASQYELYKKILPAFKVKKRLLEHNQINDITNEDIWKYLIENKWRQTYGLTLSEMVNDIINLEPENIR